SSMVSLNALSCGLSGMQKYRVVAEPKIFGRSTGVSGLPVKPIGKGVSIWLLNGNCSSRSTTALSKASKRSRSLRYVCASELLLLDKSVDQRQGGMETQLPVVDGIGFLLFVVLCLLIPSIRIF